MKNRRGLKHYLRFWGIASVLYAIFVVYNGITTEFDPAIIISILYLPFIFTLFLYVFDSIFDRIWPNKKEVAEDKYESFIKKVTVVIHEELQLSVEDYRRMGENDRFQKALRQAYAILQEGETEGRNFVFLEKKFKKDTKEYKALKIVIEEVKKMSEEN